MTTAEPERRRRSSLTDDDQPWSVSAKPEPPQASETPASQVISTAAPEPGPAPTRRQRTLPTPAVPVASEDEALKKKAADSIYAWAAAEHKATLRMQRMIEDLDSALSAGATAAELGGHIASACKRHDIESDLLPDDVRARLGLV